MRTAVILAIVWLGAKIAMLYNGIVDERIGISLNLLFIIIIIFLALRSRAGNIDFVSLVKTAMRPAAVYVVLASIAIFAYYNWVDPNYLPNALDKAIADQAELIESKGGFQQFKKGVPGIKEGNAEEYLLEQRARMSGFVSPFSAYGRASIALLTLTFFAGFYSLFMVALLLIAHKYLKKG